MNSIIPQYSSTLPHIASLCNAIHEVLTMSQSYQERKRLMSLYHHRYAHLSPVESCNVGVCFYCGDIATEKDHLPSLATIEYCMSAYNDLQPILVPSCSECNSIAGDRLHLSLNDRFTYIQSRYKTGKKGRLLDSYLLHKDDEELEYGENLGRMIKASLFEGKIINDKVQHIPFDFYINGDEKKITDTIFTDKKHFTVFGQSFKTATAAETYSVNTYKINRTLLRKYLGDCRGSFDRAVKLCQIDKARKTISAMTIKTLKQAEIPVSKKMVSDSVASKFRSLPEKRKLYSVILEAVKYHLDNMQHPKAEEYNSRLAEYIETQIR